MANSNQDSIPFLCRISDNRRNNPRFSFPEFPSESSSESSLLATEEYLSQKGADWRRGDGKITHEHHQPGGGFKDLLFLRILPLLGEMIPFDYTDMIFFRWVEATN